MSFFRTARDAAGFSVGMRHPILAVLGPGLLRLAALVVVFGAAIAAWDHRADLPWWAWPLGGIAAVMLLRRAGRIGRRERDDYDWD
ncbi:hypothetical protein GCM10010124_26330 [Pilimelia terevasa]|uniref:Uncharacterized protein n=1 Tax=Pilimelia terevasa TaxID=53372 RepID=A0A8J3BQX7_9ACTN|nr:hypothetical protein [Pilimelia terevasa]GGK32288.1 hypothetical protein GCM10010124_26330 [Pilimelia terevasa]